MNQKNKPPYTLWDLLFVFYMMCFPCSLFCLASKPVKWSETGWVWNVLPVWGDIYCWVVQHVCDPGLPFALVGILFPLLGLWYMARKNGMPEITSRSLRRSLAVWICMLALVDNLVPPQLSITQILQQRLIAAQYYVDWSLGVDTNNGTSWVTPMQSITQITKNLNNGDAVYCAESPDPTSIGNATWTAGDRSVVLATACAQTIYTCDTYIWKPGAATVTCDVNSAYRKEGTHSAIASIEGAFTTGLIMTANLGVDLNCSAYRQISFWMTKGITNAIAANRMALILYSDDYPTSALTNVTGKAYLPSLVGAAFAWQPVTVDYGSALGIVRTIVLIAEIDPGYAFGIYLDNILACKAPAEADSLTLTSLISKNTAGEPWFALASINGTAVELESLNAIPTSTIGSYGGSTGAATTYKRETWKTTPTGTSTTAIQTISDSGADGAPIQVLGGYTNGQDVTTAPTGLTIYDGANGYGYGIYATGKSYVTLSRLGAVRYSTNFNLAGTATGETLSDCISAASTGNGINAGSTRTSLTLSGCAITAATGEGIAVAAGGGGKYLIMSNCVVHGCDDGGIDVAGGGGVISDCTVASSDGAVSYILGACAGQYSFYDCVASGSALGTYAVSLSDSYYSLPVVLSNFTSSGHVTGALYFSAGAGLIEAVDSALGEAAEVTFASTTADNYAQSTNHDDSPGSHYKWEYGATYNSTQAIRHTASGWAWQLSPTNAARSSTWPLRLPIGQVALTSGQATTVTCWMRRSNTGLSGGLVCPGGQITGIASDVSDTSWTVAAGEWEQQSIPLTSTENGVVTIEAQCYGGTTYSLYADDASCNRAKQFKTLDWGTGRGPSWTNHPSGGGY